MRKQKKTETEIHKISQWAATILEKLQNLNILELRYAIIIVPSSLLNINYKKELLPGKLFPRPPKRITYKTLIRPIVTYGYEIIFTTITDENNFRVLKEKY